MQLKNYTNFSHGRIRKIIEFVMPNDACYNSLFRSRLVITIKGGNGYNGYTVPFPNKKETTVSVQLTNTTGLPTESLRRFCLAADCINQDNTR